MSNADGFWGMTEEERDFRRERRKQDKAIDRKRAEMGDAMGDHGSYGEFTAYDADTPENGARSLRYNSLHTGPGPSYSSRAQARRTEHTGARLALARIDRERRRLAEEEERILSRPAEPLPGDDGDGPVVYFRKRFGNPNTPEGKGYQFVAVRVETGKWFLSGKRRTREVYSWEELLDFAERDETTPPVIWVADDWSTLEPGLQD